MKVIESGKREGRRLLAPCLAGCLLVAACGGDSAGMAAPPKASSAPTQSASGDCKGRGANLQDLHLTSDSGFGLTLLGSEPMTPFVGDNAWLITLTQDDTALLGIAPSLEAVPFMPDHGHGTAVPVDITEPAPGRYLFAPVNLRMPGYWEVTITLTGDGGSQQLMVPVCVK
jgi:hypothetical protein